MAAPTLAVAHDQRLISANKRERVQISGLVRHSDPSSFRKSVEAPEFVRKVLSALYTSTLACFVQGLNVVARANAEDQRDIDMSHCIKIWRAGRVMSGSIRLQAQELSNMWCWTGCIIRSETITDQLLPIYQEQPALNNLLLRPEISAQFQKGYQDLKDVVLQATAADFMVPCLSATLEYVKQVFSTKMPTSTWLFYERARDKDVHPLIFLGPSADFQEAQMDFVRLHALYLHSSRGSFAECNACAVRISWLRCGR